MRHAVKRPAKLAAPKPGRTKPMLDVAAPAVALRPAQPSLYGNADTAREARAQKIKRSELVSKFSDADSAHHATKVRTSVQPLAVAPVPAHAPHPAAVARPASHSVIEKGLANATSHTQPKHHTPPHSRRKRGRLASAVASGLAILLLGGFITYQNIPNISMRYAAQRAGISAAIPNYQPAGFALNSRIQYTSGQITMKFNSNTDDREFTITQRESNWNSDTLRSNYVASTNEPVQTFEDKGRTIYLYGNSNATWVNGGVWYDIKGDSQLNSDQLIRIATSM